MPALRLALLLAVVASTACTQPSGLQGAAPRTHAEVDFSGAWEVDYSKSESVSDRYEAMMRELRRQVERREAMNQGRGAMVGAAPVAGSGEDVYALARLAELVTDVQLLNIEQDSRAITVKREGSFALYCEFLAGETYQQVNPLGSETCGWDGHQLVFQIVLPEGVGIVHRMTLGPRGERLQVATTVRSRAVSVPFTVDRVFLRYDPTSSGIRCQQTLTRGRVCTTERPQ